MTGATKISCFSRHSSTSLCSLCDSPEHLWHSKHEGVMQEETQRPTQEVKPGVPPQSVQQEEPIAPPLCFLPQKLRFFWHCSRNTGLGPRPGPGPGGPQNRWLPSASGKSKQAGERVNTAQPVLYDVHWIWSVGAVVFSLLPVTVWLYFDWYRTSVTNEMTTFIRDQLYKLIWTHIPTFVKAEKTKVLYLNLNSVSNIKYLPEFSAFLTPELLQVHHDSNWGVSVPQRPQVSRLQGASVTLNH